MGILLHFCRVPSRGLQSLSQPIINKVWRQEVRNCIKPGINKLALQSKTKPLCNHECIRTKIRDHYRPNAWKRIHKNGVEKYLKTQGGREILFRKFLKGRKQLCVFDRFLNRTVERGRKGRRMNLFDPKTGYKSLKIKREEYYNFDTYRRFWPLHK